MAKNEEEIKAYILRRLGSGIIDVELTPEHLEDVIDDTKRWYGHRVGQKRILQIPLITNQTLYILESHVQDVLQVIIPSTHFPAVDTDDFSFTYSLLFGQWRSPGASPMPYSDLVQRLQYLETASRIFSADREFEFNPDTKELQIMPRPLIVGNMLVEVWTSDIDTRDFVQQDESFFLRWSLAHAKEILGEIRGKFDSIPMVGGDRGLNAERLLEESKTEKEQIEKDILNWRRAVPIVSG